MMTTHNDDNHLKARCGTLRAAAAAAAADNWWLLL
jgi:hypothetical protein